MRGLVSARRGSCTRPLILFLALLPGLLAPVPALAQTRFGHQAYTQTSASPQSFSTSFLLPASVPPSYYLHLENGKPDGSARVLSGSLVLNGVEVGGGQLIKRVGQLNAEEEATIMALIGVSRVVGVEGGL